jgi:multisubunit Na+/H+ antiporter MnhE subunit
VWVVTLSSVATSEMASAAGSSLLCAVAATAARSAVGGRWRPSPRWVAWLARIPVAVVVDTVRVWALAASHSTRRTRAVGRIERFRLPRADEATTNAREALATLAVSSTPGSFVFDVDEDEPALIVHALVPTVPSVADAVVR